MEPLKGKGGRFRTCVEGCNRSGRYRILILDRPYGYPNIKAADNAYCEVCKRKVVAWWDGALEREELVAA